MRVCMYASIYNRNTWLFLFSHSSTCCGVLLERCCLSEDWHTMCFNVFIYFFTYFNDLYFSLSFRPSHVSAMFVVVSTSTDFTLAFTVSSLAASQRSTFMNMQSQSGTTQVSSPLSCWLWDISLVILLCNFLLPEVCLQLNLWPSLWNSTGKIHKMKY